METVYCNIFGQRIIANKCFLKTHPLEFNENPSCQACPKYEEIIHPEPEQTSIVTPDQLRAFFKEQFQSMLTRTSKLKDDRKEKKSKSKKDDRVEYMRAKRKGQIKEKKRNEPTYVYDSVIEGSDKTYFNLFVYELYSLLTRAIENQNKEIMEHLNIHNEAQVYECMSSLFTEQGYKKHNGENYSSNDIKSIIERADTKEDSLGDEESKKTLRKWFESFSDWELEDFCNSLRK